jgi:DNA uptake protein ComE-like DNA-binding protein
MGLTAFNRQRRLKRGVQIPSSNLSTGSPAKQFEVNSSPGEGALRVINEATSFEDILALPTIGESGASIIFVKRPEGGYASLDDLPGEVFTHPLRGSMNKLREWTDVD